MPQSACMPPCQRANGVLHPSAGGGNIAVAASSMIGGRSHALPVTPAAVAQPPLAPVAPAADTPQESDPLPESAGCSCRPCACPRTPCGMPAPPPLMADRALDVEEPREPHPKRTVRWRGCRGGRARGQRATSTSRLLCLRLELLQKLCRATPCSVALRQNVVSGGRWTPGGICFSRRDRHPCAHLPRGTKSATRCSSHRPSNDF